jgi:hypothetical protein
MAAAGEVAMATAQADGFTKLRSVEKLLGPTAIVLGLAGGAYAYWLGSSIWLGAFVFLMVLRFIGGSLPKIIHHPRRVHRTLFYLLWPGGGSGVLYLVYQWTHMMWLAAILGVVGGLVISIFVGLMFFKDVAQEDQEREKDIGGFLIDERLAAHPEAVAMRGRFSEAEWDEIRSLPERAFTFVALSDGEATRKETKAWADIVWNDESFGDPLLCAMIVEAHNSMDRLVGTNDPLVAAAVAFSDKSMTAAYDASSTTRDHVDMDDYARGDSGRHAFDILDGELSPAEFRSFFRALFALGFKIASADGSPTKDQLEMLLKMMPARSIEDLKSMLGAQPGK